MTMISHPPDGFVLELGIAASGVVRVTRLLLHSRDFEPSAQPIIEVATVGSASGSPGRYTESLIGARLRHVNTETSRGRWGPVVEVELSDSETGLSAMVKFEYVIGTATVRVGSSIRNDGDMTHTLVLVSSSTVGSTAWDATGSILHHADNDWASENRWRSGTLRSLGQAGLGADVHANTPPRGRFSRSAHGTWSTGEYLPIGALETADGRTIGWQIEQSGPWHWQVAETANGLAVLTSGATGHDHAWSMPLAPGDSYSTPVSTLTLSTKGVEGMFGALTEYRRRTWLQADRGELAPVVYNDYMNTLMADPTTEKLLPLIAAVGRVGADVFCIDAGWYTDDAVWSDYVGAWAPSTWRFPGGIGEVIDAIRAAGMVPGLWMEPEVIGYRSEVADGQLPDDAYFMRGGERVGMDGRFHLDFRHPAVVARLDAIVDGLIADHGIGYFKFDYNISPYAGTDVGAPSPVEGQLRASSAFLDWVDGLHRRHPELVIESCASGAMRSDWATMSRFALMSTSDQQDALASAPIAAAAATIVPPEQAGVWCYPQPGIDTGAWTTAFAGGLLTRPLLSGHYDLMSDDEIALVASFIRTHRAIREEVRTATPAWPMGLPRWDDPWIAFGLRTTRGELLLSVWRRGGDDSVEFAVGGATITAVSPLLPEHAWWTLDDGRLTISIDSGSAVTLRIGNH